MVLSAGVSLPLIAIGKQAVEVASTFESQMNVLGVAARSSGTAMGDLSKAAILVGADTQLVGISASEAADAMTNFYKAGIDDLGDLRRPAQHLSANRHRPDRGAARRD